MFLALVRISPGIHPSRDWLLVVLLAIAIGLWVIGHLSASREFEAHFKSTAWLVWAIETTILIIFSKWTDFLNLIRSTSGVVQTTIAAILAIIVTLLWIRVRVFYSMHGLKVPLPSLVAGLTMAVAVAFLLIG